MDIRLDGKAAIVTGGSKGIGYAIASRFAASGGDVAIVARGREALAQAAVTIGAVGAAVRGRVIAISADVSTADGTQRVYDEAMAAFGKVDILVNNAGTSQRGPFEDITDEVWQQDFDLKLFAA